MNQENFTTGGKMSQHKILFLSSKDVKAAISIGEVIPVVREAFRDFSSGDTIVPQRENIPLKEQGSDVLTMPAFLPQKGLVGVKLISLVRSNPARGLSLSHAILTVMDAGNGLPLAVLDGEYLTALRTGAASGVATDCLSAKEASVVAIFGGGTQGRTQLQAMCTVRPIVKAIIFDPDPLKAELFSREMRDALGIDIVYSKFASDLKEADIICTATTSLNPVFEDKNLKPGVHINSVGSYRPDMCEIPPDTVARASVFADSRQAVLAEAGDLIQPIEKGLISSEHIKAEIGEVITGDHPGRENIDEITFFKSVGIAVQDLAAAGKAIEIARIKGLGTYIEL